MTFRLFYYVLGGEDGRTVIATDDIQEWSRFWAVPGMRRVKQSVLGDVTVSTVFLGLDHGFHVDDAPRQPIVFESMVFGGSMDGELRRYATYDAAEAGHADLCELVEAAQAVEHGAP